jgi:hypothetical protein
MEAYFLPLAQTALTLAIVFNPDSKFISNYFSLQNIKNSSSQYLQNNDFKIDKKADSNLNFEFLWQKSDEELKKKLNPEQLRNLALHISLKLINDFSKSRVKTNEMESFDEKNKINILQQLKRSSEFLEFSSKQQLIENLKSLKNPEETREEVVQTILSRAFLGFLTASYQINEGNNSPKNQAINKFVNMLESFDISRVFQFKESSKIKFLKYLNKVDNSFQSQSFVN